MIFMAYQWQLASPGKILQVVGREGFFPMNHGTRACQPTRGHHLDDAHRWLVVDLVRRVT